MERPVYYGGQAVLEGVMIRGPKSLAVACRRPNGRIALHSRPLSNPHTSLRHQLPLLRGVVMLGETLSLGIRALAFSSRVAADTGSADQQHTDFPDRVLWGSIVTALLFVGGLFFATPNLIASGYGLIGANHATIIVGEGVTRLVMLVGYVALVGRLAGIKRVFQYHGAEHMTIHAHEAGAPLTVAGVRPFAKEHTRCGTSFLLIVVVMAFFTYTAFDLLVDGNMAVRLASRVVLLPAVAAVSYEILRLGARFGGSAFVRVMFLPNLALQGLTTNVPDDDQIEVAIAAFSAAVTQAEAPLTESASAPVGAHGRVSSAA